MGTIASDEKNTNDHENYWNLVGFHKTMAGFWYNLILTILEMAFGLIMSGIFLSYLFPYPDSNGYNNIVGSLFVLLFQIFDLGTASTIERFIAESRIKDIHRMVKYIQWFVWYQSFTGLAQVSIITAYVFTAASQANIAYLMWLMIISSIGQYPGYSGVFKSVLDALQIYDKSNILGFISGQLVGRITGVAFIIGFKYWGIANPQIGELLGIAMGNSFGGYVSSLLTLLMSSVFFSRALKKDGITVRDCFRVEFDWPLVKEVLQFGLKTGLPGIVFSSLNYSIFIMNLTYIPQYPALANLVGMTSTLLWVMGRSGGATVSLYSESYLNGKKNLVQFYLAQSWRFIFQILFFLASILAAAYFILPDAFLALKIEYYYGIFPFLFPVVFGYFLNGFFSQCDPIIIGANRPMVNFVIGLIWTITNVVFSFILLVVLQIPRTGMGGILFVMVFKDQILLMIFGSVKYIYIHKKIVPIKFPFYQAIVATAIPCLCAFSLEYFVTKTLYQFLFDNFGFLVALFPMFVTYLVSGIIVYFIINAAMGGYDTENLEYLRKSVSMSGPSKGLVKIIYSITAKIAPKSPFFNKFPIPWEKARKETEELYELKMKQKFSNVTK
jgi:hypothetical protein